VLAAFVDFENVFQFDRLVSAICDSLSVLQIFRSVVDDRVARAAPAPADIIIIDRPDPPTSIVAPNQNLRTTIPLKRNGTSTSSRCAAQGGSSRSLCSAQPRPMRLGLPARPPRARV
jgi:hypothetical protein